MRAALYLRVSTDRQATSGDSLETQDARLRAYCVSQGVEVTAAYVDAGLSAKDTNRPQLQALLADVKTKAFDVVVTADLSRISRSVADIDTLVKTFSTHGVRLISLRENLDFASVFGRGIANLLTSLNQIEREQVAERVGVVKAQRVDAGKFNGGTPPFGYWARGALAKHLMRAGKSEGDAMKDATQRCPERGRLYVDEAEAAIVRRIFKTFCQTNSLARCRDDLNAAAIRHRNGQRWSRVAIHRVLENPVYLGKIVVNKRRCDADGRWHERDKSEWIIKDGLHEPIVTPEEFEAVATTLSQAVKPRRSGRIYLFSGLIRCGHCGSAMTGGARVRNSKRGGKNAYYKCSHHAQYGAEVCQGVSWRADELEAQIVSHLKGLSEDGAFLAQTEENFQTIRGLLDTADVTPELKRLDGDIRRHQQRLSTLLDALQDGLIQREDFQRRYTVLKEEVATFERQRDTLATQSAQQEANYGRMKESFHEMLNLWHDWEELSDEGKQKRLQSIVEGVTVTKDQIDIDLVVEGKVLSHLCSAASRGRGHVNLTFSIHFLSRALCEVACKRIVRTPVFSSNYPLPNIKIDLLWKFYRVFFILKYPLKP